uniref:U6 snRNA-associated Sm-like protein LSm2 n=1 Tax=Setaria digitata TaxID=48799 RepID=A0A915Q5X4_9BILA
MVDESSTSKHQLRETLKYYGADISNKDMPARIEYLNSQFLVFDSDVASYLMRNYRIVTEACGTSPEARADLRKCGAPFVFMPEQVAVLVEYEDSRPTEEMDTEFPTSHSTPVDDVSLRKKAELIAKGRKVKELKRQADGAASAATLKVRRCEIDGVEVTASEIDDTLKELSKTDNSFSQSDTWLLPLYDTRDEAYEELERPPFPENSIFRIRLNTFRDLWRRGYYLTCGLKFGCDYLAYECAPGEDHSKWLVKCVDSQETLSFLDLIALSRLSSQVKKHVLLAIVSPDTLSPYYIEYSWWKPQRFQKLFYSFFKSLVGKDVVVELKNDLSICGTLHSVDQYLNMKLTDISVTDSERYPHMLSVKNCFIRGSVVRYVQLPADQVDTQLLQDASRKEVMQAKRSANA